MSATLLNNGTTLQQMLAMEPCPTMGAAPGWPVTHGELERPWSPSVLGCPILTLYTGLAYQHRTLLWSCLQSHALHSWAAKTWAVGLLCTQATVIRARHLDLKQSILPVSSPNKNTLRNLRAGAESPSYYWFSLTGPMQISQNTLNKNQGIVKELPWVWVRTHSSEFVA